MCMHTLYIYMCIYNVCTYTFVCMHVMQAFYVCVHVCYYVGMHVCGYVHVDVCMYVCTYV